MRREGIPLKLVIIDYLQLIAGQRRKGDSRDTEVGDISRALVALAGEFNVALILVSQLNRKCEERPNKRPQLSDLRESGAIEQDAYTVSLLYRDEYYYSDTRDVGVLEERVAKNRNGRTGVAKLDFLGESCRVDDPPDGWNDLDAPADERYP
jgi:replicative DNA helicase